MATTTALFISLLYLYCSPYQSFKQCHFFFKALLCPLSLSTVHEVQDSFLQPDGLTAYPSLLQLLIPQWKIIGKTNKLIVCPSKINFLTKSHQPAKMLINCTCLHSKIIYFDGILFPALFMRYGLTQQVPQGRPHIFLWVWTVTYMLWTVLEYK